MKLSEATYFPDAKELTRHGFVSHMEDFIGKLIGDSPLSADVDDYLKGFDIDSKKALEMLTKPEIDGVPESAVVMRTERIKNGGTDEFGKPMKDEFQVIYRVPKKDMANGIKGIDEKLRNLYIKLFENHIVEGTVLNEEDGGNGCDMEGMGGATNDDASNGQYPAVAFPIQRRTIFNAGEEKKTNESKKMKRPIGRLTMFITEEQMEQLAQLIKEDGEFGGDGATSTFSVGNYQYDAPVSRDKENDKFWKPATDTDHIFAKSFQQNESKIHIKKKNKGKLTATKKRTGKSTEELTHSKNPLTRKRAIFAQNAKKWNKK